jgi:predicted transcriptional regulator with HTH domain
VAAEVGAVGVSGRRVERVAAGVVHPLVRDRRLGRGERRGGVAQPLARRLPDRVPVCVVARRADVDGRVVRGPGGGLDVERLDADALIRLGGVAAVANGDLGNSPTELICSLPVTMPPGTVLRAGQMGTSMTHSRVAASGGRRRLAGLAGGPTPRRGIAVPSQAPQTGRYHHPWRVRCAAGDGKKIICEDKKGWRWGTY